MKVAVYFNNHNVQIEDRPIPMPDPGGILVQTKACGVCVADTMEWYLMPRAPLSLGHEPTGVVVRVGDGTTALKEGDRVFVHHHVPCLICEQCRRGNFTMCNTFRQTHIRPGGFSEYFTASSLHVERDTLKLPESISFEVGTLIEPLACVIHAIKRAKIQAGDSVALIGTGVMGLMFIQALKFWGVRHLAVYEVLDWRRKKAIESGAPLVLMPLANMEDEAKRFRELTGSDGTDKVIVAAKDLRALEMSVRLANKGGTVLFFATPQPDEFIKLFPSYIFFNEITVTSSYSADHLDTQMALELLSNGTVAGASLLTHRFPIERLSDAIVQTASRQESLKSVITFE